MISQLTGRSTSRLGALIQSRGPRVVDGSTPDPAHTSEHDTALDIEHAVPCRSAPCACSAGRTGALILASRSAISAA